MSQVPGRTTARAAVLRWSLGAVLAALSACKERTEPAHGEEHSPPAAKSGHEHEHHDELAKHVKLTDAVVRDAAIETTPARREALGATLSLPGEVASDPDRTARISSPAAGRIEEARLRQGESVKKGDVLVVVRVPEIGKVRSAISSTAARATAR